MPIGLCLSPDQLSRLSGGELAAVDIDALEPHLLDCPRCAAALQKLVSRKDMLTVAMAAQETLASDPLVKDLMHRLQKQRPMEPTDRIRFECRVCSKKLACKPELAGRKIRCPGCQQPVLVPQPNSTAMSARTSAASRGDGPTPVSHLDQTIDFDSAEVCTSQLTSLLSPPERPDELGRLGTFRVLKVLGHGGMGVVFQAEDPSLDRMVALKAMLPALAINPTAKARFLREAKAAASVHHPHIVVIHRVEERPVPFLAMEFLQGESLDDRLKRERTLPATEVMRIGRQIAEGLAAAHARGLVHRDIKPANVWLDRDDGHVKILDFGLARSVAQEGHLTQSGAVIGTPAYMAPEQAAGGKVDHRGDLFSLGCVLYRLATGEMPFKGDNTLAILTALAIANPVPPAKVDGRVSGELSKLIMELLVKDPAKRIGTASEVVERLKRLESARDEASMTSPQRIAAERPSRRRRWALVAAFAALLLLGGGIAASVLLRVQTDNGTLLVDVNDPSIQITVKQSGVSIFDKTRDRQFQLKPGDGVIEVYEANGVGPIATKTFTLNRGGKETVRVRLDDAKPAVKTPPPVTPPVTTPVLDGLSPERRTAEWLVANKHEFSVINQAGQVIEVRTRAEIPNTSFTFCRIQVGQFDDQACQEFADRIVGYTSVFALSRNQDAKMTDAGFRQLMRVTQIQSIFGYFSSLTDLSPLANLSKLEGCDLHVGNNGQADTAAEALGRLPSLRGAMITGKLSDAGVRALVKNEEIGSLYLNLTYTQGGLTDASWDTLAKFPKLTGLTVLCPTLSGAGIGKLKNQKISGLNLSFCKIRDDDVKQFRDLPLLRDLQLHGTPITDEGLKHLEGLPLNNLGIHKTRITPAAVEAFKAKMPKCTVSYVDFQ